MMHATTLDAIVIGSGPGGATAAKKLSEGGLSVTILEWGSAAPLRGTLSQMAGIAAIPGKGALAHPDLSLLLRGITTGGTSTINFASVKIPPFKLFKKYGVDLIDDEKALRSILPIHTLPDRLTGPLATQISLAAKQIGLNWQKLEKFIHLDNCRPACPRCTYGCPYDAKWSARNFVDDAQRAGATLLTNAKVTQVLHREGRAYGVKYTTGKTEHTLFAPRIVLAAGGIGSPRILQNSGFPTAGRDYFVDPVIAVMGTTPAPPTQHAGKEIPMTAGMYLADKGITLADLTLPRPLYQAFVAQVGRFDRLLAHGRTLSIMVKIKDDLGGSIGPKWLNKSLTSDDRQRFSEGTALARDILQQAGARQLFQSHHFAAHPGGGAKIGDIVDANLETNIKGLFVCDASVIPEAWGLPPSYTIMCLAHRLGRQLAGQLDASPHPLELRELLDTV